MSQDRIVAVIDLKYPVMSEGVEIRVFAAKTEFRL